MAEDLRAAQSSPAQQQARLFTQTPLEMSGDLPYNISRLEEEMTAHASRTTRLETRISPDALALVRRAAEIQGRSVSDFVVLAAQEAAHKTITETQIICLSVEDQKAVAESILNPPGPTPALRKAKAAHERLIAKSR
jgi:uncharacterized protein (DUF1778 family)